MKAKTIDWLKFAKTDLDAAEILFRHDQLAQVVAFHSQQAIEKSLKAVLEEKDLEVPRTHKLLTLVELVKTWFVPDISERTILALDKIYLDSRYPAEIGLLPDGIPTKVEISYFLEAAARIHNQVHALLK